MALKVSGLEGLKEQLEVLEAELTQKALATALRNQFKPVVEMAKRLVPKDTGALAASLSLTVVKPSSGATVVAVGLRVNDKAAPIKQARVAAAAFGEGQSSALPPSRRWHFVELGTIKMPARPFARPALDSNAQGMLDGLKGELVKAIQAAVARKR
jgi:HK97 gp10 family phage protein